ncbi:MAG TPA: hypothetical protein VLA49_01595 [Anaerolineales bacterium]|nr:hypothetical protein [Anaerolineales bacterium]
MDALMERWQSLPGSHSLELKVLRAWQGRQPADALSPGSQPIEIWCVEVQLTGEQNQTGQSESTIWIVTRENQDASWIAAWLMTMSSIWPYQACGTAP